MRSVDCEAIRIRRFSTRKRALGIRERLPCGRPLLTIKLSEEVTTKQHRDLRGEEVESIGDNVRSSLSEAAEASAAAPGFPSGLQQERQRLVERTVSRAS